MSILGITFMFFSWSVIIGLGCFCFIKMFKEK